MCTDLNPFSQVWISGQCSTTLGCTNAIEPRESRNAVSYNTKTWLTLNKLQNLLFRANTTFVYSVRTIHKAKSDIVSVIQLQVIHPTSTIWVAKIPYRNLKVLDPTLPDSIFIQFHVWFLITKSLESTWFQSQHAVSEPGRTMTEWYNVCIDLHLAWLSLADERGCRLISQHRIARIVQFVAHSMFARFCFAFIGLILTIYTTPMQLYFGKAESCYTFAVLSYSALWELSCKWNCAFLQTLEVGAFILNTGLC